ncbi:MAG: hypothetical protein ABI947_01005 [Chloroflexota bacterium]
MLTLFCEFCEESFEANERGTKKYCSPKCKTAAFRARVAKEPADDRNAVEKAIETKQSQERSKVCLACGKYFEVNGLQHRKKYCNAACKMAYMRRLDWSGKYAPKNTARVRQPVETIKVVDNLHAQLSDAWEIED